MISPSTAAANARIEAAENDVQNARERLQRAQRRLARARAAHPCAARTGTAAMVRDFLVAHPGSTIAEVAVGLAEHVSDARKVAQLVGPMVKRGHLRSEGPYGARRYYVVARREGVT